MTNNLKNYIMMYSPIIFIGSIIYSRMFLNKQNKSKTINLKNYIMMYSVLILIGVIIYSMFSNKQNFNNKRTASRRSPIRRSGRQNFNNKRTASRRSHIRRSGRQNFSNKKENFSIDGYNNKEYYSI